jgi:hypothetical protein
MRQATCIHFLQIYQPPAKTESMNNKQKTLRDCSFLKSNYLLLLRIQGTEMLIGWANKMGGKACGRKKRRG